MAATAKTIVLRGDKRAQTESAEHHIEFPGGAVSVCRVDEDGSYWAHIALNRKQSQPCMDGFNNRLTEIVAGRIDYKGGLRGDRTLSVVDLPDFQHVDHIAIQIRPASTA